MNEKEHGLTGRPSNNKKSITKAKTYGVRVTPSQQKILEEDSLETGKAPATLLREKYFGVENKDNEQKHST